MDTFLVAVSIGDVQVDTPLDPISARLSTQTHLRTFSAVDIQENSPLVSVSTEGVQADMPQDLISVGAGH